MDLPGVCDPRSYWGLNSIHNQLHLRKEPVLWATLHLATRAGYSHVSNPHQAQHAPPEPLCHVIELPDLVQPPPGTTHRTSPSPSDLIPAPSAAQEPLCVFAPAPTTSLSEGRLIPAGPLRSRATLQRSVAPPSNRVNPSAEAEHFRGI
ncbi:hypothetical protein NDU88_004447 [Pleurodeles waltl]|uniref:Uncharacterized protein n=1 Tax=Pleurodeles waltl TaxID=8319 RepID=A0AAV7TSG6_PLEWA|nr:hypothetical protein NDU88_004447 [Pleurodeles waltl]